MGFPGRLENKKNVAYGFWFGVLSIAGLIIWGGYSIIKIIKTPLPPPKKEAVYTRDTPGLIRKTGDRLVDNSKQIIDGKPLQKPKSRVYSGSSVVYAPDEKSGSSGQQAPDYYSDKN